MTYEELLGYCRRAVGMRDGPNGLYDVLTVLMHLHGEPRGIAAETVARFLVEYVEADRATFSAKKPH